MQDSPGPRVRAQRSIGSLTGVNEHHAKLCSSPEWAEHLQTDVLTPLARDVDLGAEMVEVGPGPGAATDWLRHRVERLVVVEFDEVAAEKLVVRFAGTNVEAVHGEATAMTFVDGSFDSAGSFTMLHHAPTFALQNMLLAEVSGCCGPVPCSSGPTVDPATSCTAFTRTTPTTRSSPAR